MSPISLSSKIQGEYYIYLSTLLVLSLNSLSSPHVRGIRGIKEFSLSIIFLMAKQAIL
jgi:hypothetical protein